MICEMVEIQVLILVVGSLCAIYMHAPREEVSQTHTYTRPNPSSKTSVAPPYEMPCLSLGSVLASSWGAGRFLWARRALPQAEADQEEAY